MSEYHKIQSVFKREERGARKLILGDFSLPSFEYLYYNQWECTEKVDGTNIRVIIKDGTVTYGGRTENASLPAKLVVRLQELFNPHLLNTVFPEGAVLYGEGYGAGIQSGGNYRQDQDFVLFDVKVGDWWLESHNVTDVAKKLSIDRVPIVQVCDLETALRTVRDGFKSRWGDFQAEGFVCRPVVPLFNRDGSRVITKIKVKDF